ncbi:endonuclease [Tenacibaculum caenipelagi]|uniref:Endonuclease I n=1 Tax=Tenacibaculum caenipelagi TaxID=1325435 RepID=A0A4R6TIP7_9FLAO|nr:endonuclease [Tenacibaculum caenipelagi]TDQ28622.1 endonuclease I [Tenacibaculum caenipelagi]
MKKVIGLIAMLALFINCGGSDNEVILPEEKDTVIAVNDSFQADENTATVLPSFLENDTYTSGSVKVTFETSSARNGTIVESNNMFTYTPAQGFVGTDTFKYTICSTITPSSCSTATVVITVKALATGNTGNFNIPSEISEYYKDIDFTLTGSSLKEELATTIISTHTTTLSYTPGVWDVLKQSDLDLTDNSKVVLIYGYDDNDGNYVTDRTRDKNANGGTAGTQWNREHVYAKSLGTPDLGTSGPGADAHHLRPCDITFNSQRGNKLFATGSGKAGDVSGNWYPGDEWKGDVARMMMYMYVRYGNQCLPKNVAVGSVATSDSNMVTLLLQWNAEDPVSDLEMQRNNVVANAQGNRNPFIDNPYLATVIWSGSEAENTWK